MFFVVVFTGLTDTRLKPLNLMERTMFNITLNLMWHLLKNKEVPRSIIYYCAFNLKL